MGMYKSPITIIESTMDSFYKTIIEQKENAIVAKIQSSFGVDVDKDELLRALQHDRGQYEKGYSDAMASIVRCKDCKHYKTIQCSCGCHCVSDDWYCGDGERRTNDDGT